MASTINQTQIVWSTANSISLTTNSRVDSDAVALNVEDAAGSIQIEVDNAGTPASGDVVDVYIKWSNGDVSGSGGSDTYDTDEHAANLCRLNTYPTDTPGEDPARMTVDIPLNGKKGFKLSVVALQGASRNITLKARLVTKRYQ